MEPSEAKNLSYQSERLRYEEVYKKNDLPPFTGESIVKIIGELLESLVEENSRTCDLTKTKQTFNGKRAPSITVRDYMKRILQCADCSKEVYIIALIYLDRITAYNEGFVLSPLNIHRILIVSVMMAAKFYDDKYYSNMYYSKVGGITNTEINFLEMEFLSLLKFNLHVSVVDFLEYLRRLLE